MSEANDLRLWWGRFGPATIGFLVVVGVALFVYSGSMTNEFVWDDPIVLGQQLQAFHSLHDIFFPPPRIPQFGRLYYRPLIVLSYVIDRWLWGDTPFGFHFPVVLFHALNSGFVFLLGRRLLGKAPYGVLAALSASLLFATHPIHTESVCWMAGRSDTLAALFLLPSLLAYFTWKQRAGTRSGLFFLIISALLFLLGCLVKESALGFLVIIGAVDFLGIRGEGGAELGLQRDPPGSDTAVTTQATTGPGGSAASGGKRESGPSPRRSSKSAAGAGGRKAGHSGRAGPLPSRQGASLTAPEAGLGRMILGWAALGVAGLVYFGLRSTALAAERGDYTRQTTNILLSLKNVTMAIGFYISKIFVPTHLDAYIPNIPSPGLALLLGLVGMPCAALIVFLAVSKGDKLLALFVIWFFGALAPSLAIAYFVISEAPVAERYLYLPSVGFCLLVAYLLLVELPSLLAPGARRAAVYGAVAASLVLAAVYGEGTIVRARVWKKDLEFWKDGVAKSPNEGLPHLHLGLAYANLNDQVSAEREYRLAIDPTVEYDVEGRSTALNNLGMLYMGKGNYDQAEDFFQQAIHMRPDYATPHYGIGVTSMRRAERLYDTAGREEAIPYMQKSEQYFRRAIELNPQYVKALNQLAYLLANTGHTEEAMQNLDRVFRLVSRGPEYEFAVKFRDQLLSRPPRNRAENGAKAP